MIKYIALLLLIPTFAIAGAKTIGDKKDYTRQQKIQRGDIIKPKMTTCRLKKRVKAKDGSSVCIYIGGNKTYELAIERNCPKQYKCQYNPNGEEPNIDSIVDSLNENFKN
tara:strand:+ start:83 stop:412 length:330 start_codon:yes stop_codon:yes gene_type:complete